MCCLPWKASASYFFFFECFLTDTDGCLVQNNIVNVSMFCECVTDIIKLIKNKNSVQNKNNNYQYYY